MSFICSVKQKPMTSAGLHRFYAPFSLNPGIPAFRSANIPVKRSNPITLFVPSSLGCCISSLKYRHEVKCGSDLTLFCRNLTLSYHNLTLFYHNLTLSYHNLTLFYRNLTLSCGNLTLFYRNLTLSCGNLTLFYRNLTLSCGNLILSRCKLSMRNNAYLLNLFILNVSYLR